MRLIKLALLSVFFLFLIITAFSLLIPSHVRISKAINLYASKDSVFSLVNKERWPEWHPAYRRDSAKFPEINIISQNVSDSEIVMHLQQGGKRVVVNGWKLYDYVSTDSITLQWYMDFNLRWYPWQKFASLFYENTYGKMMEEGLTNLKGVVEE